MPDVKERPISIAERKKAEELIKQKFDNLQKAVDTAVKAKEEELALAWERKNGIDKKKARIAALEEQLKELREQVQEEWDPDYRERRTRLNGPICDVIAELRRRRDTMLSKLMDERSEALKKLWFGILSSDALNLINTIPSIEQLKNDGLAMLTQSATKLLK